MPNQQARRPQLPEGQWAINAEEKKYIVELGRKLTVVETVSGGGTDAAFAALNTRNPVLERFGLLGFGAHSNSDEFILIDSIAPRLYLAVKLIMDFSQGLVR